MARGTADPTVRLSDRVMAVDYLSRAGLRDQAAENELLRLAAQLAWEDRVRLALVLARGGDGAARWLLEPAWEATIEGRTATLPPDSRRSFYFSSGSGRWPSFSARRSPSSPTTRWWGRWSRPWSLRVAASWVWNTQDYGTAVEALARLPAAAARRRGPRRSGERRPRSRIRRRVRSRPSRDSERRLRGIVETGKAKGRPPLRLDAHGRTRRRLDGPALLLPHRHRRAARRAGAARRPRASQVERWYERYDDGKPVTAVAEGELVRVRLRVTVPSDRHFVVLDDALPAGLEAVDLSLRTAGGMPGPGAADTTAREGDEDG